MGKPNSGAEGSGRLPDRPEPHAAGTGGQADRLKDMQAQLQDTIPHHPVVLDQQAQRAADLQLRIGRVAARLGGAVGR